jgi:hypothetical protein
VDQVKSQEKVHANGQWRNPTKLSQHQKYYKLKQHKKWNQKTENTRAVTLK